MLKKEFFSLPENIHYLNCATMSPLPKVVEEAGIKGLLRKSQPYEITQEHFFDTAINVKKKFAKLINCIDYEQIAIMPSVSYGMATVVKNILKRGFSNHKTKIVLVGEEFPSDVYGWRELVAEKPQLSIETIHAPEELDNRGQNWNSKLLEALDQEALLVCISPTHWAEGTLFHLEEIKQKCAENDILFIIDATQHLGAYAFDIQKIQPDFLVAATYKWLLGPYGTTLAYFGKYFDNGFPLEQTWIGRKNSQDFKNLINYQSEYQGGAFRYNMGEFSNFINLPMVEKALDLLIDWQPEEIHKYAKKLGKPYIERLKKAGYWIENKDFRAAHLFGIRLPENLKIETIQKALADQKVFVSYRGNAIRLSINVWNDEVDMEIFTETLVNLSKE
ncbi:aminotransferase class V-fold PLP-dependent enzyme [Lacihabitans sp. CCS-44]|uniref:aminotransferase class V-fold PLP-dependent enzyme n=1 Tax=Lacihabitans sp. CCS-44 TaxID=2487331 RepID=UPI0020CD36D5|nr:aminotransferase class V-fold PLP-dependent enzyme [Lacihabitans sp. CCS-44]MCP9755544.1 aminotransferase class V-fold PLP-dependent enzyme [Lacihabitans sp. CCS-44]